MNVKETSELLVAAARIVRDSLKAHEDGKVTKMEAVRVAFRNTSELIDAFVGIADIPAELLDIDQNEVDQLYTVFVTNMGWTDYHFAKNLFDAIFRWVRVTVSVTLETITTFKNCLNPPKAEVVQEA